MRLALALVLVTGLAHADATKDALAKGRKLANQKQYAAAIAAFEDGLNAAPDDPTLLAEAGFAAYLAKDYGKAEALTRKSLSGQATPSVRGASLYNLGMIREARKDPRGAIDAYKQSLAARPHRVVRAALAKLDPAAAAAADSLVPAKLAGPFASLAAYCKSRPANEDQLEHDCTCGDKVTDVAGKVAPFEQLQQLQRGCSSGMAGGHVEFLLAAKLPAGWYVFPMMDGLDTFHCNSTYTLGAATAVGPTLRLATTSTGKCIPNGGGESGYTETGVLVLGVGASKVPSASTLALQHDEDDGSGAPIKIALVATWKSATELELAGKVKGIDVPDLIGPHTLVFP